MRHHFLWSVILSLAAVGLARAQETTTGSITGMVIDAQGRPVPGAAVTLASVQGARAFTTDGSGRFFAPFLTPGRYSLRVERSGFSTVEQGDLEVSLGRRVELTGLVLQPGLEETIEVVGAAPVIDTNSTTVGGTLGSDHLRQLPVGRRFTDALYLVPGVSASGAGTANPSMGGNSGLENNYVVDGVNITHAGYGAVGSYSVVFGSLGSGVTTDFVKETQVKTAGFEAEYGQATGGVVNVVTQSGTNAFHGSVFGYWRPDEAESGWAQLHTVNGTVNTVATEAVDFGAAAGGPLARNKLFVFGAFNPQYQRRTMLAPEGFPLKELGGLPQRRRALAYAGKLTWQLDVNHRLDFSAYGDPSHGAMGPQRVSALARTDAAGFSEVDYGGHNQVLRWDGILARNWLMEASIGRATNLVREVPAVDAWAVLDTTVVPHVRRGGIGFYEAGNEGTSVQYSLKSTHMFDAAGNHQVRYGVQLEDTAYTNVTQRTGPTFVLPDGTRTATGAEIRVVPDPEFGRLYRVTRADTGNVRPTRQEYLGFFLQDTWQVGRKLTVRPGIRYEQQTLTGSDRPPLCRVGDSRPGLGDGPGAPVPCRFKWSGNWAPRVGVTYDLGGDGRSKLFASWGRFFARVPNNLAARALSADAGVSRADYFDAALTRPVPEGVMAGGQTRHFIAAGLGAAEIDPEARSAYQDELLGGFEWEPVRGLSLGVRYVHRDMPRILEDVGTLQMVAYDVGGKGAASVEYFITNVSADTRVALVPGLPGASFEDPEHVYDAVEVSATRQFSGHWGLIASYRWSRLEGNFEGFFRSDNGQSDPSISSLFDFPTNDPTYATVGAALFGYRGDIRYLGCSLGCGALPNDRTHQAKVFGNYRWGGLNLGLGFSAGSGRPLTPMAASPAYNSAGEIPEAVRGSGIQTVDGFKERTNPEVTFDLHLDYTLRLSGRRVTLIGDVFNLFNRRQATEYDQNTEIGFRQPNPDFGTPKAPGGLTPAFQPPRQVRLGARFEW